MEVTAEDFVILQKACDALDAIGVPYMVGGGTAVVLWGRNRRTKDFDLFLNREVLRAAMNALSLAGFTTTDTEKNWLYKAWWGDLLVDLIVEVRGGVRITDETMLRSRVVEQFGVTFRVMGPEDVVYRKITCLTEGRPDWHDAISIIARQGETFDWMYLLYLAQQHPRRVLAFLLFAQTEMNAPACSPSSQVENQLFRGDSDGPIPEWVVLTLVRQIWEGGARSPINPHRLEMRRAA
ncbi:MAG: hypothetical protein BWY76_02423 [bacterium ADurb.Bin429]|nr:MAG: hypothetical protein BWY76_02423 [bacterium ADurb.Bin429]